ncbi:MAG: spermidine synthase [Myxococcota bacterium]
MSGRRVWWGLGLALVCSGVAGIVNQVVWQRALKVVLGGSETLSSMIVVLVFLLGLGLGALIASGRAARLTNPLRALAGVELLLAAVNAAVAVVLGLDISETVYAVQRVALASGIPLRAVYAAGAGLALLPPTLLMGATVPLASEAAQRQLGATDRRLVPLLFFINTGGAAIGAALASLWWLPWHGQSAALAGAVALNVAAAALLLILGRAPSAPPRPVTRGSSGPLRREEVLGFFLGFLSLGYEMVMFRTLSLANGPVPATFAAGLCAFLLAWAVGTALSRWSAPIGAVAIAAGALAAVLPPALWAMDAPPGIAGCAAMLVPPVIGFGWLYGQLVSRRADDWGHDVGRYSALNTLGSCLGVLALTLLGYALPLSAVSGVLGLGLVALGAAEWAASQGVPRERRVGQVAASAAAACALALGVWGFWQPWTLLDDGTRVYWGRDGVVAVDPGGDVYIDGLWHTRLVDNDDHIGRPYTWLMAAAAVLAHGEAPLERALIIGAGVGVSGVTLAGVEGLQVDGYEINTTLRRLLEDYPEQTLGALRHRQLRWIWQDARTGLALDETRYDIILSAPLHLKQAGSSLLLSREYLRLVKARLAPGGVVAFYSNEGVEAQNLLIQRTVAEAFTHRTTWYDGLVTVASDHPIATSEALIQARMQQPGALFEQMRVLDDYRKTRGEGGLIGLWDGPDPSPVANIAITDDWPLIEHPEVAEQLVVAIPPQR